MTKNSSQILINTLTESHTGYDACIWLIHVQHVSKQLFDTRKGPFKLVQWSKSFFQPLSDLRSLKYVIKVWRWKRKTCKDSQSGVMKTLGSQENLRICLLWWDAGSPDVWLRFIYHIKWNILVYVSTLEGDSSNSAKPSPALCFTFKVEIWIS